MTTRCLRLSRALLRVSMVALLVLGVSAGGTGCSLFSGSKTQRPHPSVAQGELYRCGNPNYDEFFEDLYDLEQKVKPAENDDKKARKALGDLVGSSSGAVDDVLRKARVRVEQLGQAKVKFHFEIDGIDEQGRPLAGKPVAVRTVLVKGKALPKEATDFGQAFEAAAKSEAQLWEKYGPLSEKARRLEDKADALATHVDTEFDAAPRRNEVKKELQAAKTVLSEMGEHADKVFDASTDFLQGAIELLSAEIGAPPPPGKEKAREERAKERDRERKARSNRTAHAVETAPPDHAKSAPPTKVRSASNSQSAVQTAAAPATPTPPPPPDFNP